MEHPVEHYAYVAGMARTPLVYRRLYREITVTADTLIDILIPTSLGYPVADHYRSLGKTHASFITRINTLHYD